MFEIVSYVLIGGVAGVLAGLLGVSGGIITVPALFFLFTHLDLPQGYIMHYAIGTSMAAMIFNSLSATYSHNKRKAVIWPVLKKMFIGIVLGSIAGAVIADHLSGKILEIIFGVFALLVGFYFFWPRTLPEGDHRLPSFFLINLISFGVSFLANILGIGGGIITVPILMAFKMSDRQAIGSSSAITLCITTLGALLYLYFGIGIVTFHESIGFIYLPAFLVIAVTTLFAAPFGVKLAHQLPSSIIRKIFACALIATGVVMIFS